MPARTIRTEVIIFRGVVQGVGFRPTVYRIAGRLGMKGRVRNMGGAVQLVCTGTPEEIDAFVSEIIRRKPPMARVSGTTREIIGTTVFHEFSIGRSSAEEDSVAIIPADIALCGDCLREFYDPDNVRYSHPFISCTNCGPRYTIMEGLPYDRDTTTMAEFEMCKLCEGEYSSPQTVRYHAQTISCHECGPRPRFAGPECDTDDPRQAIALSLAILKEGGILALKGVGGYYLVCSPYDEEAVRRLREIKHREQKPFAVMFRDIEQVKEYCLTGPREEEALSSPVRPIVLLEQNPGVNELHATGSGPALNRRALAPGVCNTSRFVGAFLPSFGLQYLLLDALGPLIMTSANISDLPIITADGDMYGMIRHKGDGSFCVVEHNGDSPFCAAEERGHESVGQHKKNRPPCAPLIAGILFNERRIAAGLDDSVVRVIDDTTQLIRRSKGYVPSPVYAQAADTLTKDVMIFAAGAHLKSTFALSKGAYSYLSQHFGDLDSIESEAVYRKSFERMKSFFDIKPGLVVCDLHPNYYPTKFAESLGLPVIYAQHHHAHIASVMAEHGLLGPVIGVAFDGTGKGTDGAVWGGEILICEKAEFRRCSHLRYVDMIGSDAAVKDARNSAVSHLYARDHDTMPSVPEEQKDLDFVIDITEITGYCAGQDSLSFTPAERHIIESALRTGENTVKTSSIGRLFDAVCAMLGIHFENRYEGECAIMLENAAGRATGKLSGQKERLALDFHKNVAQAILQQCRVARDETGIKKVALSGGVFQNKILMEETLRLLRKDAFTVYYNIHVPPNDGGIALGQNYIGMLSI